MSLTEEFKEVEGRFDVDPMVRHFFADGIVAKQMELPAGCKAISHKHNYGHISILSEGKCIVRTDNGEQAYIAPACINIVAGLHHEITAIEDVTWFCIHATNETDETKLDEVLVCRGAH